MGNNKKRIEYIDYARGIAMLLVILGHCFQSVEYTLNHFILSFHMPLFFFLSGIFAKSAKDMKSVMGGVKSKAQSLLIPQVLLCVIGGLKPTIIAMLHHSSLNILDTFGFFNWWFLPTLFMCIVFYMLIGIIVDINKISNKIIYMICLLLLIWVSIQSNQYNETKGFFRCLQIVPAASFFYVMGSMMRAHIEKFERKKSLLTSILTVSAFCICFVIANINTPVLFYMNDYGNLALFFMSSILGCFSIIYFSTFIKEAELLKYIGKYCVVFYVWQFIITSLCVSVSARIVTLIPNIANVNIQTMFAFAITLPILYFVVKFNIRYCPYLYGLNKLK